jgi:lysophospholipase L1-like esterase
MAVIGLTSSFRAAQLTYAGAKPGEVIVTMSTVNGQQILKTPAGEVIASATAPEVPKRSPFFGVPPAVIAKDVLAAFEQRPEMREPLFFDGGHPDADGYKLMAERIAEVLKERALVP